MSQQSRFSRTGWTWTLILSFVLGAAAASLYLLILSPHNLWLLYRPEDQRAEYAAEVWPPPELHSASHWAYMKVEGESWTAKKVGSYENLGKILAGSEDPSEHSAINTQELAIPTLPRVYPPTIGDKCYYDMILRSDIAPGEKVLVIGCGSGADSWVAWLKSQGVIYAIDINPMAVVNTRVTAQLGNFPLHAIEGDFRSVELPEGFCEFDVVLWNMPYLAENQNIEDMEYFDGDDGTILDSFLERLPSLLKPDGKAIIWNYPAAKEFIAKRGIHAEAYEGDRVYVIPNPQGDY